MSEWLCSAGLGVALGTPGAVSARGAALPSGGGQCHPSRGHHEPMALVAQAPKKSPEARGESPQELESSEHIARQYLATGDGSWTAGGDKPL